MKTVLVTGAGGFIGNHLVSHLKKAGYFVRGVDVNVPEWTDSEADEFELLDLRYWGNADLATKDMSWVFNLAANMGGAGFVFTGMHDAEIIRDNTLININMLEAAKSNHVLCYLFSSSACVYPMELQELQEMGVALKEHHVYPANPDSVYGWEKLHAEHLCKAYTKAGWVDTRIVRFHNIYGTLSAWEGGREKVPAAMCRKIAMAKLTKNHSVEIWGGGEQHRSFMYIDDCIKGIMMLMNSHCVVPLNLGRDRAISINSLVDIIADIAGIEITKVHIPGPQGVWYRNSDNTLFSDFFGWVPQITLEEGLIPTYKWVEEQCIKSLS